MTNSNFPLRYLEEQALVLLMIRFRQGKSMTEFCATRMEPHCAFAEFPNLLCASFAAFRRRRHAVQSSRPSSRPLRRPDHATISMSDRRSSKITDRAAPLSSTGVGVVLAGPTGRLAGDVRAAHDEGSPFKHSSTDGRPPSDYRKKPLTRPGLKCGEILKSIEGPDRTSAPSTEAVVEPYSDHVHVLADPVTRTGDDQAP